MPDKTVRDFVAAYLRPHRPRLALLAVLFFAGVGLQLANPLLAKTFIDQASAGATVRSPGPHRRASSSLVALLTQVATVAEVYVAEDLGWRTTNALRVDLTAHVLALDDSFHADHGAGELLERIDGDVAAIAGFFARFVVHVLGSALFLLGVLALLWREDWRIGAVLTAFALGSVAYLTRGGDFVGRRSRQSRVVNADLSAYLEERLSALPDIKANGADDATMRGLHERLADRFRVDRDALLAASLFSGAASAALVAATVASLGDGGVAAAVGGHHAGRRLPRVPVHGHAAHAARAAVAAHEQLPAGDGRHRARARAAGDRAPHHRRRRRRPPVGRARSGARRGRLRLRPGAGVAAGVVSARARTRARPPRPHRVGQDDDRPAALPALRRRRRRGAASAASTCATSASTTYGGGSASSPRTCSSSPERSATTCACSTPTWATTGSLACSLRSGSTSWLAELPDGLDTVLGPTARGLSAGEAQLVALARVFLEDPGLVVLDEASSRLDPHTEELLERAIDRLLAGRTGIVIAHRLRTIERADEVLVLEGGRVVEHGDRLALAADPTSRLAELLRTGLPEVRA